MAAMAMSPLSLRQQTLSLHDMLRDMAAQEHLLLMGNQGVGCSILTAIDWASHFFLHFFGYVACDFVCHYFFQMSLLVVIFYIFFCHYDPCRCFLFICLFFGQLGSQFRRTVELNFF